MKEKENEKTKNIKNAKEIVKLSIQKLEEHPEYNKLLDRALIQMMTQLRI
ncbi:hypothetical protein ONA23_03780 [Mycoplasmopsis cynos]|nr:hypothetical protein [Mycoplasmopsis cynos]WAM06132.1 hypothetical protein ONA23_03780 [Mycoplasmopsis cynos]